MAKSCAIIPKVRSNKGTIVESRLFKDLLSFTSNDRSLAVRLYEITKGQQFIQEWNPRLTLDDNNEPTLRSLLQKTNLNKYISNQAVLERLNRDIGYYKKGQSRAALWLPNAENIRMLTQKAIQFNTTSDFRDEYVASVINILDSETNRVYKGVKVERRNKLNSINAEKMEYNHNLNSRLRSILSAHGISIGALSDLEERMGINGVTDFDQAKNAAEGIVELIRLAQGEVGEKALPEEFAHFALAALGDNPLVQRLVNNIANNGLAQSIIGEDYDSYVSQYDNDPAKLATEAAGKLLADHLLKNADYKPSTYKSLLQRVVAAVKNFFSRLNATSFKRAMLDANIGASKIAKDILGGRIDEELNIANITESGKFFNLSDRVARDKKILQGIINNELKRLKIYEKRNPDSPFSVNQRLLIDRLDLELADNNEIEGIYTFIQNALGELEKINNRLITLANTPATDTRDRARVMRDVRNYLYSYKGILDTIRAAAIDEQRFTDNRYGDRVKSSLDATTNLLGDLFIQYNNVAMPLFVDFIKPFVGENIVVPFGKWKGKTIKAEDLVKIANDDISFFDRWLDSMADSSSYMLKVMDQAVKKSKENARLRTINVRRRLEAAGVRLEQAGIKGFEWMFETDSKGNKTGKYISEIDYGKYKEAKDAMLERLKQQYGDNPVGENVNAFNEAKRAWYEANLEVVNGKRQPKMSLYASQKYKSMNQAQREFYDTIMEIKSELDSYLPEKYTTLTNAVKIRKDLIERVKQSDGVKQGTKQLWEAIKDQFIRRTDDTEFGDRATVKDFEGNEVQVLPIYFTKLKEGESANDMSTDVISTMIAYASMANDFDEMNKVIDVLEVGRDILRDNLEITKTRGGKPLMERFTSVGRRVESVVTKGSEERRIIQRLNDFFEMQVYGRYMADEGTFGKTNIDKGKVANFINRVTSLNMLGLNILSGISNVATGKVMMRIESFAGEFYTESNTLNADLIYGKELPAYLAEIGNRVKTSKIALWDELFNVMQEYEQDVREVNFDRKTWFSRMFGSSALFVMNNAGEHWMQNRTSLALADAYKMKAPDGKIVSLWDAMEVVYTDPNNKKLGAKLQLKQGYTKEDGSAFTNDDIIAFSRKSAAINQRMHGIYNKADRSAVQRLAVGRMAMMFRKWIKPSLNRRFKSATYNYDMQAWTEGYYNTTGRFLWQLAKELKEGQFAIVANWENLTSTEKANIRRALTEVGHFLILAAFLAFMEWGDKDRPWEERMLEYQARRLYTELGAMIPGPQMSKEAFTLLKSPAAGIKTAEGLLDLIGLLNPFNYETFGGEDAILQSGRYKGHNRAYRLFFESPVIPMNKTIYRGLHPEESIPFFKQ